MSELQRFRAVVISRDAPPRSTVTTVDVDARDAVEARHLIEDMIGGGSCVERLERVLEATPATAKRGRRPAKPVRRPHDASHEFDDADYDGGVSGGHFLHLVVGVVAAIVICLLVLHWAVPGAI
ncbi:MAG TPA: hypothetical protein VGO76_04435 [Luteibacter sp.]|jgi:hypothetical protein|nr:hypothetical protein [Luteibacter sp.]